MPIRRISAGLAALGCVLIGSSLAVATPAGSSPIAPELRGAGTAPLTSVGVVGVELNSVSLFTGLTEGTPALNNGFAYPYPAALSVTATATSPTGTNALVAGFGNTVQPIDKLTTHAVLGARVDLKNFVDEGAADFDPHTAGLAIGPGYALVTLDEQGVVQLRRTGGKWHVDRRVQSSGKNEGGGAHQPGFIRIPQLGSSGASQFEGVATSSLPLPNGKFLAVIVDRVHSTLAVVEGVGTAHPKVMGSITSPLLKTITNDRVGDGGVAFSPATATRAAVVTPGGLAVLNLTRPAHPVLQSQTAATLPGEADGLAIAPDGDHLVLDASDSIFVFSGLLKVKADHALTFDTSLSPPYTDAGGIKGAAFTRNSVLVFEQSLTSPIDMSTTDFVSTATGVATGTLTLANVAKVHADLDTNTLSVTPALATLSIHPRALPHARVGHHFAVTLSVSGGIGHFSFAVTAGHLPKGLKLIGKKIVGKPTHSGAKPVTITATNQYGGAVLASRTVTVRHR